MQSVAQSWLVYRLSHSGYWLGVITFCGQMPAFLMSPLAGVVADRADRRKVLIVVQFIELAQALVLAALVFSGAAQLWHIIVLAVLLGIASAFDMTTRHSFAIDMVGKEDLSSAIALNSVLINITRIFGPMLAGTLLAVLGEAWCFSLNAISYLPVIWSLWTMTVPRNERSSDGRGTWENIVEGFRYARREPVIFRLMILSALVCLIACPYVALLPIFAQNVLSGGPATLAWLTGMLGLGAVTSSLFFKGKSNSYEIRRQLTRDVLCWGAALAVLGLSRNPWLSYGAMFSIGYFMMSLFPTMNTTIQQIVEDRMRGRVMSLYTMTFLGTMPLGSLVIGWAADRFSAPRAVTGAGALTFMMGLCFILRSQIRYRRSQQRLATGQSAF